MADRIDVFISSTSKDLGKYRAKVKEAVLKAGAFPIAMEEFDATERNALQKCYDELQQAEIFIGIYAHRYGFAPGSDMAFTAGDETRAGDAQTSITHYEYLWALEKKLPMLLYVVSDKDDEGEELPWPPSQIDPEPAKTHLADFKKRIMGQHVVGFFYSPDHLAAQVSGALPKIIAELAPKPETPRLFEPKRRDFYQHIALPDNYVPRTDLLNDLRLALLGDTSSVALTSGIKSAPTALHGMGGIGKSVMARALCDDPAVQAAFPDGILWTTLGQEPALVTKLREWVVALGGSIPENAPTEDSLKANLAGLLENRACLLVVDDVWQRKHADAFRVGGLKCRLLVTTRDAEIARLMGADVQSIPVMAESEAVELLQEWAKEGLQNADDTLKRQIVNRVGRLPLAVKLSGAQLQKKDPRKWLETFDARKLASKRPEGVHDSLEQTFGLSLDALGTAERKLYAALVIFKEDEPVREVAIRRLWSALGDLDEDDAQDLVDDLGARALMEVLGSDFPRAIALHDLLRDFMAKELGDSVESHQILLDTYAKTQTGSGWHTAPDDGYLYDHLIYHLVKAGLADELPKLFANDEWIRVRFEQSEYTYDGYIEDLESTWHLTNTKILAQIEAGETNLPLIDCLRYALIRTTINSISDNYLPEIVAKAVETGLWTSKRGLSIAKRVQRAEMYIALLSTGKLNTNQHLEVEIEAFKLGSEYQKDKENSLDGHKILSNLAESEAVTPIRRLEAIRAVIDSDKQSDLLIEFAMQLGNKYLDQVLQIAENLPLAGRNKYSPPPKLKVFIALLPQLEEVQKSDMVLKLFDYLFPFILSDINLAGLLVELAPYLQGEFLLEALRRASLLIVESESGYSHPQVEALISLLPFLDKSQSQRVIWIERVYQAILQIAKVQDRSIYLMRLSVLCDDDLQASMLFEQALSIAMEIPVMKKATKKLIDFDDINDFDDDELDGDNDLLSIRLKSLLNMVEVSEGKFPIALIDKIREVLSTMISFNQRAKGWADLAELVIGEVKNEAVENALYNASLISNIREKAEIIEAISENLSENFIDQVLSVALELPDNGKSLWSNPQARLLSALGKKLSGENLNRAIEAAFSIINIESKIPVLSVLAERADTDQRNYILKYALTEIAALDLENRYSLARAKNEALRLLVPLLEGDLLAQALESALVVEDELSRVIAIENFISQLRGDFLGTLVNRIVALKPKAVLEQGLTTLESLSFPLTPATLSRVIGTLSVIDSTYYRVSVVIALARQCDREERVQLTKMALDTIRTFEKKQSPVNMLLSLAEIVESDERVAILQYALEEANNRGFDEDTKIAILVKLSQQAIGEKKQNLLSEAYHVALSMTSIPRGNFISGLPILAEFLSDQEKSELLNQWLDDTGFPPKPKIKTEESKFGQFPSSDQRQRNQADILKALAPHLTGDLLNRSLKAALRLKDNREKASTLVPLALQLEPEKKHDILRLALDLTLNLEDDFWRASGLRDLAPHLTDELLNQGLQAALKLPVIDRKSSWLRSLRLWALGGFLPVITDSNYWIDHSRRFLLSFLWESRKDSREYLLRNIEQRQGFTEPILSPEQLVQIADSVIDICWNWRWQ